MLFSLLLQLKFKVQLEYHFHKNPVLQSLSEIRKEQKEDKSTFMNVSYNP